MELHIGIDDTDSMKGGCTTYIAARLVEKIARLRIPFIDYPNIIRLNPNIPYKTRGNAAVALRLQIADESYNSILETVLQEIEENSQLGRARTEPAAVFIRGSPTFEIRKFSDRALWDVLSEKEALKIVRGSHGEAAAYGAQLGLVGAMAAVGQTLKRDHTFELVAYRAKENWGTPRRVDEGSVKRMDRSTRPGTFNNYDYDHKRVLITPHGPDPVLLGIRGEDQQIVLRAFRMLIIHEPIERWVTFRTNHGTEAHLQNHPTALGPNRPVVLMGSVESRASRTPGGHVIFRLRHKGRTIHCAAYEPTGSFRENIAKLIQGDKVTVFGAIREPSGSLPLTVNLEKIHIDHLIEDIRFENPKCPRCRKHMKSAGRSQGFRCERCGMSAPRARKRAVRKQRKLRCGFYIPTPRAQRHLTKPYSRYGREKTSWDRSAPSGFWHSP